MLVFTDRPISPPSHSASHPATWLNDARSSRNAYDLSLVLLHRRCSLLYSSIFPSSNRAVVSSRSTRSSFPLSNVLARISSTSTSTTSASAATSTYFFHRRSSIGSHPTRPYRTPTRFSASTRATTSRGTPFAATSTCPNAYQIHTERTTTVAAAK